jgi:hypothetical protein
MNRFRLSPWIVVLILSFGVHPGVAQTKSTSHAPVKQKSSESFSDWLLRFLGIADTPSTLKGPGDEVKTGQLWLRTLGSNATRPLTRAAGYRSPVFLPGSADILALHGSDLMRVPTSGGDPNRLYSVDRIIKLVGFGSDDPGKLLVLLQSGPGEHPGVALLSTKTGELTAVPYDPASTKDLQMVENLESWSRTYGDRHLYVKRETKEALSGTVEWTDVFLKAGNLNEENVSHCDGAMCGQPALSENGQLVVYVKSSTE